jgi:outer membrane biosynthesis protein TonB
VIPLSPPTSVTPPSAATPQTQPPAKPPTQAPAPPSNAAPPTQPAPTTPAKPPAPPSPPQPAPQNSGSSSVTPSPAPAATGFAGNWKGKGGCGFASLGISQQGNVLTLQGLPGNGAVRATSSGNGAQAEGVNMLGKPNWEIMLFIQGNQLAFEATGNTDSCRDDLRRQ